ncbi:MAG: response regulator [Nitrospirota bacterium]
MTASGERNLVLVIDDDRRSRSLLESHLLSLGFDAVFAQNAGEAKALLSQGSSYVLIITDLMNPATEDSELVGTLKLEERTREIPVLGTSSFYRWIKSKERYKSFIDGFVPKPITRNILKNEIKRVMSKFITNEEIKKEPLRTILPTL